ncbi:hypothetical protein Hanom_Chr15g01393211 [Helianthus anomalus]
MASPSIPSSPPSSSVEEDAENVEVGGALPVLKWNIMAFRQLMLTVRLPDEYGSTYPKDGDTAADAPVEFVTLFADMFGLGNFRLPLMDLEPTIENFRRFYRLQAQLGFYSFQLRVGPFKILVQPPKGFTLWKSKFFYVKEATVACKQYFRSVFVSIPKEMIPTPTLEVQEWYQGLQAVLLVGQTNKELHYLRMMLWWKPGSKTKLVCKEKDQGNLVLAVGMLAALGVHPAVVVGGKGGVKTTSAVVSMVGKAKKPKKPVTVPVNQITSGTFHPRINKSEDYVLVSDTLEGLYVLGQRRCWYRALDWAKEEGGNRICRSEK